MYEAEQRLSRAGAPGARLLDRLRGGGSAQLSALLGATEHEEPVDDQERELLAFACWTLDKVAKS